MRKSIAILILLFFVFSVATACAGNGTTTQSTQTTVTQSTQTTAGTSSTKGEPVTIQFLFNNNNRVEIFRRVVDAFNESQNDIIVDFQTSAGTLELLMTRLATNDVPDMSSAIIGATLASFVDAGHLVNLKDEEFMSKIIESELESVKYDDGIWAIPMDTQTWGVFYNKKLFTQAQISSVPQTLDELKQVVEKLNQANITPFAAGFNSAWTIGQFLGFGCSTVLSEKALENKYIFENTNWTYDTPAFNEALEVLDIIKSNTQDRPSDTDVSGQYATFASEEAAMMCQGNWSTLQLREINPDIEMGMFPLPVTNNADSLRFPVSYGFNISVMAKTNHLDEVRTFINFFLDPESEAGFYYDEIGLPTAVKNAKSEVDSSQELLREYIDSNKTILSYSFLMPSGLEAQTHKIIGEYANAQEFDHLNLITKLNDAFNVAIAP